ncbi:MAG: HD domain-containing phosphohydrolase [Candidatus Omnitrophota bacterium]
MRDNSKIKSELVQLLSKNQSYIVSRWASQILKVPGHKRHKDVVPVSRHKVGMTRFFKLFISFLDNQHDARALKYLTSLILDGFLSINTAEDVIHGQMLLRKIIAELLISKYKHDFEKLYQTISIVTQAIDKNILLVSAVYKKRDFDRLHTLVKSGKKLVGIKEMNHLLEVAVNIAVKESDADRGSIMLLDNRNILKINASVGIPEKIAESAKEYLGKGIAGTVAKTNMPIMINKGQLVDKDIKKHLKGLKAVSALTIPLSTEGSNVLGVLNVVKYPGKALFNKNDLELLSILAYEIATSIKNYQLNLETESLYIGTIFALAAALDARDHYTHGHSRKVARYAVSVAKRLNMPKHQIAIIRRASLLHDIGKIGIPDKILNKPAKLTKKEFEIVKTHSVIALDILKPIPQLRDILPAVYHEHERYDGKGYVAGLKGEAIPIEARIIGVADAYDAMTSERPYRKALTKKEAICELKRNAGTQFDPTVVKAFIRTVNQ